MIFPKIIKNLNRLTKKQPQILYLFSILLTINIISVTAQQYDADTANVYRRMLNDPTDDLMEDHPADDIYGQIWTSVKLNPYLTPIDSLKDSIKISCADFYLPTPGYITSKFGARRYRYHYGTDLKLQTGDSVRAAFDGKIRIIDYEKLGYGHYIVVRHNNGLETVYAHLSKVLVELNQDVAGGAVIALGGNTGRSTGSHLHFEFRYLGNAINPEKIVNFETGCIRDSVYLLTKRKTFDYLQEVKEMQSAKYYTVRSGDNLGKIAARHGTSVNAICRLNGIKSTKILRIGERLRVR